MKSTKGNEFLKKSWPNARRVLNGLTRNGTMYDLSLDGVRETEGEGYSKYRLGKYLAYRVREGIRDIRNSPTCGPEYIGGGQWHIYLIMKGEEDHGIWQTGIKGVLGDKVNELGNAVIKDLGFTLEEAEKLFKISEERRKEYEERRAEKRKAEERRAESPRNTEDYHTRKRRREGWALLGLLATKGDPESSCAISEFIRKDLIQDD